MSTLLSMLALLGLVAVQPASGSDAPETTVGVEGQITGIILPGTELQVKPLDRRSEIVLRIVNVFPHGDRFRYDLRYSGMEPGRFNLADWLIRKDGSDTGELPEIPVEIRSMLPPGQIEPNALDRGWLPRLGGYRALATTAAVLWVAVLAGLLLAGHRRKAQPDSAERKMSFVELLRTRLEQARDGQLQVEQFAELERMLFAFWRRRLNLGNIAADEALRLIRQHETAGPLLVQLERWMHSPERDNRVDLAALLEPYHEFVPEVGSEA